MGFDFGATVQGFLTNLGAFAPAAVLGWQVIRWQRADLTKERDEARADLKEARARIDQLADSVIKTMADLGTAIRGGQVR